MNCPLCKRPTAVKEGSDLCKWHDDERAKLERAAKGIAKESAKRKADNKIYNPRAAQFKKDNPECQLKLIGCKKVTAHVHHPFSGCHRNSHFLDEETWLAACEPCHQKTHDVLSAKEARELNLKMG